MQRRRKQSLDIGKKLIQAARKMSGLRKVQNLKPNVKLFVPVRTLWLFLHSMNGSGAENGWKTKTGDNRDNRDERRQYFPFSLFTPVQFS
jgi:hypothetical protein